jgi:hypothetical protein
MKYFVLIIFLLSFFYVAGQQEKVTISISKFEIEGKTLTFNYSIHDLRVQPYENVYMLFFAAKPGESLELLSLDQYHQQHVYKPAEVYEPTGLDFKSLQLYSSTYRSNLTFYCVLVSADFYKLKRIEKLINREFIEIEKVLNLLYNAQVDIISYKVVANSLNK